MVTSEHLCSKRGGVKSCTGCGGWKTGRKSLSVRTCVETPVISDRSQALSPGLCNPSTTQRETCAQRREVYKGRGTSDIMSIGVQQRKQGVHGEWAAGSPAHSLCPILHRIPETIEETSLLTPRLSAARTVSFLPSQSPPVGTNDPEDGGRATHLRTASRALTDP